MNERISTFADRLLEYMNQNGLKAIDIANRFKVSRSTISQYLSGQVIPKRDRLVLIADVLDVNPLWLMGYDVPIESQNVDTSDLTREESAVISAYRNSSEEIKTAVKAVLGIKKGIESMKEDII